VSIITYFTLFYTVNFEGTMIGKWWMGIALNLVVHVFFLEPVRVLLVMGFHALFDR